MTPLNSTLLIIFSILAYMIIVDKNVGEYLTLICKMIKLNVQRYWWMMRLHPQNPITNLIRRIEYAKIAEEMQKSIEKIEE